MRRRSSSSILAERTSQELTAAVSFKLPKVQSIEERHRFCRTMGEVVIRSARRRCREDNVAIAVAKVIFKSGLIFYVLLYCIDWSRYENYDYYDV